MISTVLVPLDGSPLAEQAIPYAQALLTDGGEGVLFRVVPELDPLLTELLQPLGSAPESAVIAAVRAELDRVKARLADTRVRWTTEAVSGDPAAEILSAIARRGIGLVAMATHGRGALGRATFGSVADRVSRESSVPVLLVRPQPDEHASATVAIQRLVVPLDGSDLAEAALPLVIELATRLRAPVHLVRAINLAAVLAPLAEGGMLAVSPSPEVCEQMVDAIERDARDYLASIAARLEEEGIQTTWTVLPGSPYIAIADATEAGDLVVMTSHGRSGVMRWLLGSVAEKLVREAPVPVLLVPSAGRGADGDAQGESGG